MIKSKSFPPREHKNTDEEKNTTAQCRSVPMSVDFLVLNMIFIQVSGIREKFIKMIESRLHEEDISLENNPDSNNGLAIAFALNYSRLNADVVRDLRRGACLSK